MGYRAPSVMIELIEGKELEDVIYTGLDERTAENPDACVAPEWTAPGAPAGAPPRCHRAITELPPAINRTRRVSRAMRQVPGNGMAYFGITASEAGLRAATPGAARWRLR